MDTSCGGDVARNGARSASAAARSSTLGPTGGSAHEWLRHPWRTRFDTVVMLAPTCTASENLTAPIHLSHPSAGISYTTRSGVEGSRSGSMESVPGSRGAKYSICMTPWTAGVGLGSLGASAEGMGASDASVPGAHAPSASTAAKTRQREPIRIQMHSQEYEPPSQLLYVNSSIRSASPWPSASIADTSTDPWPALRSAIRAPSDDQIRSSWQRRAPHEAESGPISVGAEPSIGATQTTGL